MASMTVGLGSPAYSSERAFTALNFIHTAIMEGHDVRVFLFEDGIFVAKKGQEPGNFANPLLWLDKIIDAGVEVRYCGTCANERSLTEGEVVDGVQRGTMAQFVEMVATSERTVIF